MVARVERRAAEKSAEKGEKLRPRVALAQPSAEHATRQRRPPRPPSTLPQAPPTGSRRGPRGMR